MTHEVQCRACGTSCDARGSRCPHCGRFVRQRLAERTPRPVTVTIEGLPLMRSALQDAIPKLERALKKAIRDALKDQGGI